MKPEIIIKLPYKTFLSQIEPFKSLGIPNNSIGHKEVAGCGITTFELEYAKHHSIVTTPNVPVILGKVAKHNAKYPHNKILGVHAGITVNHIKAYLLSDVPFKKIITTPEGFVNKVLKAFNDINDLYNNFFLLYDECNKIITDTSYRGAMAAPFDTFFNFKNKALVSATTLPFSDRRFEDFQHYRIEPGYNYSKQLNLIYTNNTGESFKELLLDLGKDKVCVFFNSTRGIFNLIQNLDISEDSSVFCGEESVVKMLEWGYNNSTDEFDVEKMTDLNFFTSRYFSAFDIELPYEPHVVMISDVHLAKHSTLDPHTDIIQIPGRFRNGIKSLTHITNTNFDLKAKPESEAKYYLDGCFDTYDGFVRDYNSATNPGKRDSLYKAITESWAHTYYQDGEVNPFMVDNFIHAERVKEYYQNLDLLIGAYAQRPKHFNLQIKKETFNLEDRDLYELERAPTKKEKYKAVANLLYKFKPQPPLYLVFGEPTSVIKKIKELYPEISEGVHYLNQDIFDETNCVLSDIRLAVDKVKEQLEISRVSNFVYQEIDGNETLESTDVTAKIKLAYTKANTFLKPKAEAVRLYFGGRRTTRKTKNVFVLTDKLFPIQKI